MSKSHEELKPEELRSQCLLENLDFQTTQDVEIKDKMIGQERALNALDFGLQIKKDGYNLYVSGISGTGRTTTILEAVKQIALQERVPEDSCYLFNFEKPDEPQVIGLPAGRGSQFQHDMELFIKDLEQDVSKAFVSEDYDKQKKVILEDFEQQKEALDESLEKFANEKGFIIKKGIMGILVVPVYKNHTMTDAEFGQLNEKQQMDIKHKQDEVYEKIYNISRQVKQLEREFKNKFEELDKNTGLFAIDTLIEELKKRYADFSVVTAFLEKVKNDILANLHVFKQGPQNRPTILDLSGPSTEDILAKYQVNLLVDNQKTKGAPVIVEDNPTYYNLIGRVEHKARFGILTTDFSMIKAGAVHKANGGYLIIHANDLFKDYFAWDALKNIIKSKKVKIENMAERYGYLPTAGLKPQPMDIDLKIIMIGNPYIYYLLHMLDEDFIKTFKVKVDFESTLEKTDDMLSHFAQFLSAKCKEESLLPFDKPAVQQLVNAASRLVSHKNKLTARLAEIVDIMREADFWARKEKAQQVTEGHVNKAMKEKVYRSDMIECKIRELFKEGTLLIDMQGEKVGQVNGISVIDLGDYMFGMPSRITARTYLGRGNIIDIQRETEMGGKIHSKGVLTVAGFLGSKFAQDKPLSISASLSFEQTYEEVEGDSASSAEIYCLLSSIGNVPLKQNIAVTGSVDQLGNIQAVGGINEKIEGFFDLCRIKGLEVQGVMIPKSNVKHLMLKSEVVEAVRNGHFHIYAVDTIDDGISILTGLDAGEKDDQGQYPTETVYGKVDEQIKKYVDIAVQMNRKADEETGTPRFIRHIPGN